MIDVSSLLVPGNEEFIVYDFVINVLHIFASRRQANRLCSVQARSFHTQTEGELLKYIFSFNYFY